METFNEKKTTAAAGETVERADRVHEVNLTTDHGYAVEAAAVSEAANIKLGKDGHTVLIPQPSNDPSDPLNWSTTKKHISLAIISAAAFLPDYGSGVGAVTLLPQAIAWNLSPDTVNHSAVGNVFMLGAGGLPVVILAAVVGRLPVLFWFLVLALATAVWCAAAQSFESFMAARILNGFFSTVAQGGGLMFINDLFFFHEKARKINIWAGVIILSPFLGPLITAFMVDKYSWPASFWLYTGMTALCLILVALFMDETYYSRRSNKGEQSQKHLRSACLIGIQGWRTRKTRNTFSQAFLRPIKVLLKPTVFISCLYYMLILAWGVGINTTLSIFLTPLYHFGLRQIGFFYFTPVVGVSLGEFCGHWIHDLIARFYIKRHNGFFEPEARLFALYASTPFVAAGLVIIGEALEKGWHFMLVALGWGLYCFGMMITTVAVNAYNLDCYPDGSGEVTMWVNFARVLGGFIVSYFQVKWAAKSGTIISFSVQGGVVAAAFGLVVLLQLYGKRLRQRSGPLGFDS